MAAQKTEIQQNVKKLQLLTSDYQNLIVREDALKQQEADFSVQKRLLAQQQEVLDRNVS